MASSLWSVDAQVIARPARTFRHLAARLPAPGIWTLLRRPLLVGVVLCYGISMLTAGTVTARLVVGAVLTWFYVPVIEVLGLWLVSWRTRDRPPMSVTIDAFFVGRAPVTLFMLLLSATLASLPPDLRWWTLTRPALSLAILVFAWSVYVDVCFFRYVMHQTKSRAVRRAIGFRLFTWTMVCGIFAMGSYTPLNIPSEFADAVREVLQ